MTLRAKAEAAHREAWTASTEGRRVAAVYAVAHESAAQFIAAASPDVVLALLDRVEALQSKLVDYTTWSSTWRGGSGYRCGLCDRTRARDSDAPDDHEPTCLLRREGP